MAKSTERHQRESAAIAGSLSGISREYPRMLKACRRDMSPEQFEIAKAEIAAGKITIPQVYNWLRGETRVGVHILVEPELRDAINAEATRRGITRQALLEVLLTQIFGEGYPS